MTSDVLLDECLRQKTFNLTVSVILFIGVVVIYVITFNYLENKNKEQRDYIADLELRLEASIENSNYYVNRLNELTGTHEDILRRMYNPQESLAIYVMEASKLNRLDPLLLTALINSESSFKFQKHALAYVKGLGGLNEKFHKLPNSSLEEQIHASARVLRLYLDQSKSELGALTRYKGVSREGYLLAEKVYKEYLKMRKEQ